MRSSRFLNPIFSQKRLPSLFLEKTTKATLLIPSVFKADNDDVTSFCPIGLFLNFSETAV